MSRKAFTAYNDNSESMMARSLVVLWLVFAAFPIHSEEFKKLTGEYSVGGKTVIDPPPGEPRATHLYFALDGSAARDLYNSMKVAAIRDACGDRGALLKSIGDMQCTRAADGKNYQCNFAIDIATQRITYGVAC